MDADQTRTTGASGIGWALYRPSSAAQHNHAELRFGADGRPGLRPAARVWRPMAGQTGLRRNSRRRGRATRPGASGAVVARSQPDPATARLLAES
jgi:hypothetical protein